MFKELDPVIHAQLRLAIMSLLHESGEVGFMEIKEKTRATSGNISVQIQKLKEAGYIQVNKNFNNNFPSTSCKLSATGKQAFANYMEALNSYFYPVK